MNAGYSGTPLLKKLGVGDGTLLRTIQAPDAFSQWLAVQTVLFEPAAGSERADVVILFVAWQRELVELLPQAVDRLKIDGGLWIAWPKRASKAPTDISENDLRDLILPIGLVDNKVCAIDEQWSGLRFVWRKELRSRT
ncbi:MAG: DUF3052 family protein [Fimbriimonas sp.]|nr:DUF3052 family protein [Fimbriimonas sp.]